MKSLFNMLDSNWYDLVKCPYCNDKMAKEELNKHMTSCPKRYNFMR